VIAQLIDWNALEHFGGLILLVNKFLEESESQAEFKRHRKQCIRVIHAVADKGMDYPLKVDILTRLQYAPLMSSFVIKYRDRILVEGVADED